MSLSVIGVGLGRTGTMSLKVALEALGFGPCYHMIEAMAEPERPAAWIRAADGNPDWDALFAGFAATVDYPGCLFWRELAGHYPAAKVLLSVRDPDAWFESTQATIFSPQLWQGIANSPAREFFEKTVRKSYGERINDRAFMTAAFERHNAAVEREIPKERLLVYAVAQGWAPLCEFLGVPVPDRPFPRVNSREELATRIAERGNDSAATGGAVDLDRLNEEARRRIATLRSLHGRPPTEPPRDGSSD